MHLRAFMTPALLALAVAGAGSSPSLAAGNAVTGDAAITSGKARVNGTTIHYARAGHGPALILIHGFPEDWSEYRAIMPRLAAHYTVIAPDLRGIGESAAAERGYDSGTMAEDVYQLMQSLKLQNAYVVGHDVGGQVAFALLRNHPQALRGAMIVDTPIPGVSGWQEAMNSQGVWHVGFMQAPNHLAEKLVTGHSADYVNYFYAFSPKMTPDNRARYAKAYATPAQLHAIFEMYRAMPTDTKVSAARHDKNDVPVVLVSGEKSPFAQLVPKFAEGLRATGFTHVDTASIPGSVHYVVDDAPEATAALIEKHAAR